MGRNLYLFDVSPFMYAGQMITSSKLEKLINVGSSWCTQVTPTGGTSLLLSSFFSVMNLGDCVFCLDRNPTIKKDMIPGYKSSRKHNRTIEVMKAATEYILDKCGCTIIARAGYEADDIIYSIVKQRYNEYDNIYIYTADSDLYFLVDDKVSIRPCHSRAKSVDMENYQTVTEYMYNTLTLSKILYGDKSDNIPGLPKDIRTDLQNFFYLDNVRPHLGDKSFVKAYFEMLAPQYVERVDWVFPLMIDDLPETFSKPDRQMVLNFGDAINNRYCRNRAEPHFDVKPYVDEMHSRGIYLEE